MQVPKYGYLGTFYELNEIQIFQNPDLYTITMIYSTLNLLLINYIFVSYVKISLLSLY